jgi:ribosomal protein S30
MVKSTAPALEAEPKKPQPSRLRSTIVHRVRINFLAASIKGNIF